MLTYQIIEHFTDETVGTVEVSEPHMGRHPIQEGLTLMIKGGPGRKTLRWRIVEIKGLEVRVEPTDHRLYMIDRLAEVFNAVVRYGSIESAEIQIDRMVQTVCGLSDKGCAFATSADIFDALSAAGLIPKGNKED